MADEPQSGEQTQQPDGTVPITTIGPAVEQSVKTNPAADGEESPPREPWRRAAARAIRADWQKSGISKLNAKEVWPLFLGFAAVAVAAFTLRVMAGQLTFMELQLHEMQSGGDDTNSLARAAKRQAESTKELADRMKDQAERTRVIAEAAKRAADTAQTTFELTFRPRLIAEGVKFDDSYSATRNDQNFRSGRARPVANRRLDYELRSF